MDAFNCITIVKCLVDIGKYTTDINRYELRLIIALCALYARNFNNVNHTCSCHFICFHSTGNSNSTCQKWYQELQHSMEQKKLKNKYKIFFEKAIKILGTEAKIRDGRQPEAKVFF